MRIPVVITYKDLPVFQIDSDTNGELLAKSVHKNFLSIAKDVSISPFRRKFSSAKTALTFALFWLVSNSSVAASDFVVSSIDSSV